MTTIKQTLFSPYQLGELTLKNRFVMAPMTRARANNALANELMATYYSQRSTAGLIISESIAISPNSLGMARITALFNHEQTDSWKTVTQAVHERKGAIFAQILHTGRVTSKENFIYSAKTLGASAIPLDGQTWTPNGMKNYDIPHVMNEEDIQTVIQEFTNAAQNAIKAGFDGVEIHAANGFLLNQFFDKKINNRQDQWGGSIENRIKLTTTVVQSVANAIGADKVGVRISPFGIANGIQHDNDEDTLLYNVLIQQLNDMGIIYLHIFDQGQGKQLINQSWLLHVRDIFKGTIIVCGGYDLHRAENAIGQNYTDLIAMGVPFIANPDLVLRLQNNHPLKPTPQNAFYGEGAEGYTVFNE